MKLSELINSYPSIGPVKAEDNAILDQQITGITSDSRQVRNGFLFIAVKGYQFDGHNFIESALANGAAAVLAQSNPLNDSRVILIENTRPAMGPLAAVFYGHPSKSLTMVGITGTNGKTTTTWLIESIFKAAGFSTGVIGTIDIRYNGRSKANPITTPDAIELQKTLYEMKNAGITHVVMEVSSHGLVMNRVDGCRFDIGIFTNLSQDHLDYHTDMDDYFAAKQLLFSRFLSPEAPALHNGKNSIAVINIDDVKGSELYDSLSFEKLSTSRTGTADISAFNITDTIEGLTGTITLPDDSFDFASALTGQFNLENILCAVGTATALSIAPETIQAGINACRIVPGRLQKVDNAIGCHLFVDYAHTPDALESIVKTLQARSPKRLITLFGCGGDRDAAKRPLMGEVAGRYSHIAIVTSDNPRTEDPDLIITDILAGMTDYHRLSDTDLSQSPFKRGYIVEPDRKKALELAVQLSRPGDIVLAAGKGHETYQITNAGTIDFDDSEILAKAAEQKAKTFTPMDWDIEDLKNALNTDPIVCPHSSDVRFSTIATDSRQIKPEQVFLALKGDTFNGHDFIADLIQQGIKGFVVEQGFTLGLEKGLLDAAAENALLIFEVADTLIALGQLARYQRLRSKVKLVAITGSSGKTTTRKITQKIFESRYHTLSTKGNFNNEIGLPLTLLNLSENHEWAVVEMGMNHRGEISRLSHIALPDITLITNTAGVHLEGLGTVENVAKAKAEIFDGIRENGTAILWADDDRRQILESRASKTPHVAFTRFFSSTRSAEFTADTIDLNEEGIQFTARYDQTQVLLQIHSPARFMVDNCLAAVAAAHCAGIDTKTIQKGIAAFVPGSGRMNIQTLTSDIKLIDDAYNANPASLGQALVTLDTLGKGQTSIAVIGDMLELGEHSPSLHYDIGKQAATLNIDHLLLFGTHVAHLQKGAVENGFNADHILLASKEELLKALMGLIKPHSWILVKGSRGMAMETIIKGLKEQLI